MMLRKNALYFYNMGYNCSQCLLKAAEKTYGIVLSKQALKMSVAISNGFGIESICSVLVAAVMIFGIMFDEETAKRLRIKLFNEFYDKHKNVNCGKLKGERGIDIGCDNVISSVADITERLINEEKL